MEKENERLRHQKAAHLKETQDFVALRETRGKEALKMASGKRASTGIEKTLEALQMREKRQREGNLSKVNFTLLQKEKEKNKAREALYGVQARATKAFEKTFLRAPAPVPVPVPAPEPGSEVASVGRPPSQSQSQRQAQPRQHHSSISQEIYDLAVSQTRSLVSSARSEAILRSAEERERVDRVPDSQQAIWDVHEDEMKATELGALSAEVRPVIPLEMWLPHQQMPSPRRRGSGDGESGNGDSVDRFLARGDANASSASRYDVESYGHDVAGSNFNRSDNFAGPGGTASIGGARAGSGNAVVARSAYGSVAHGSVADRRVYVEKDGVGGASSGRSDINVERSAYSSVSDRAYAEANIGRSSIAGGNVKSGVSALLQAASAVKTPTKPGSARNPQQLQQFRKPSPSSSSDESGSYRQDEARAIAELMTRQSYPNPSPFHERSIPAAARDSGMQARTTADDPGMRIEARHYQKYIPGNDPRTPQEMQSLVQEALDSTDRIARGLGEALEAGGSAFRGDASLRNASGTSYSGFVYDNAEESKVAAVLEQSNASTATNRTFQTSSEGSVDADDLDDKNDDSIVAQNIVLADDDAAAAKKSGRLLDSSNESSNISSGNEGSSNKSSAPSGASSEERALDAAAAFLQDLTLDRNTDSASSPAAVHLSNAAISDAELDAEARYSLSELQGILERADQDMLNMSLGSFEVTSDFDLDKLNTTDAAVIADEEHDSGGGSGDVDVSSSSSTGASKQNSSGSSGNSAIDAEIMKLRTSLDNVKKRSIVFDPKLDVLRQQQREMELEREEINKSLASLSDSDNERKPPGVKDSPEEPKIPGGELKEEKLAAEGEDDDEDELSMHTLRSSMDTMATRSIDAENMQAIAQSMSASYGAAPDSSTRDTSRGMATSAGEDAEGDEKETLLENYSLGSSEKVVETYVLREQKEASEDKDDDIALDRKDESIAADSLSMHSLATEDDDKTFSSDVKTTEATQELKSPDAAASPAAGEGHDADIRDNSFVTNTTTTSAEAGSPSQVDDEDARGETETEKQEQSEKVTTAGHASAEDEMTTGTGLITNLAMEEASNAATMQSQALSAAMSEEDASLTNTILTEQALSQGESSAGGSKPA